MLFFYCGSYVWRLGLIIVSTRVHFLAGGDRLSEMLQEVAFPAMLSNSNGFSAGKMLSVALDLATLLWAKLLLCV